MKKTIALILTLDLATNALMGCANTNTSSDASSTNESTTSTVSTVSIEASTTASKEPIKESDFATPDAEQQEILDNYVDPYGIIGLYSISFSPEDMSSLTGNILVPMFDALTQALGFPEDFDPETSITVDEDGTMTIPAEIFEGVLKEHFELTSEEIQQKCANIYNKEENSYDYVSGLGGGPMQFVITSHQQEGATLIFSYEFYGATDFQGDDSNELYFKLRSTGTMTIDSSNDTFKFISNTVEKA